jgi:DNA-binding IclR family transcriptional regulator
MNHPDSTRISTNVQSLGRALDLLEVFPIHGPELGLSAIAAQCRMSKATAYRLLGTLQQRGYIDRSPDGKKYRLGARLLELGSYYQSQLDVRRLALPYLRRMVEQTGEAAFLCVREGDEALCIERVQGDQQVQIFTLRVGGRQPLHCGGAPRALLTGLSEGELAAYAQRSGLPGITPYTITTLEALLEDARRTRQQGYVFSNQDVTIGVAAVGAPVYDHSGGVAAAASLSGLVAAYTPERLPLLVATLTRQTASLSRQLGYAKEPP